jgi:hypothetical protein
MRVQLSTSGHRSVEIGVVLAEFQRSGSCDQSSKKRSEFEQAPAILHEGFRSPRNHGSVAEESAGHTGLLGDASSHHAYQVRRADLIHQSGVTSDWSAGT